VRGPQPTRVQHPLALTLPQLTPRSVRTQAEGAWRVESELAYSSIYEVGARASERVAFDAELLRASVRLRRGLAAGVDLELALGGSYGSGGFLDHFLNEFHDFIGAPNQGRDWAPEGRFEARIERDGALGWSWSGNRAQLGDTLLVLTFGAEHVGLGEWADAWRLGVELPTGDESAGAGNGRVDWIVGWNAEYSGPSFTHTFGASAALAQTPASLARVGVELGPRLALFYGLEWRISERMSWIAQLDLQAPLIDEIALTEIREPMLDLGVGFARDVGSNSRWWLSFNEDVLADSGPDFAVFLGLVWGV